MQNVSLGKVITRFYGLVNVLRTRIDMVWLFSDNGKRIQVLRHNLTSNQQTRSLFSAFRSGSVC